MINFPFVPNGKFIIFRCPRIWANYSLIIICPNIGTPSIHHFPFGTNGKVVVLGVPILKHFRVHCPMFRTAVIIIVGVTIFLTFLAVQTECTEL